MNRLYSSVLLWIIFISSVFCFCNCILKQKSTLIDSTVKRETLKFCPNFWILEVWFLGGAGWTHTNCIGVGKQWTCPLNAPHSKQNPSCQDKVIVVILTGPCPFLQWAQTEEVVGVACWVHVPPVWSGSGCGSAVRLCGTVQGLGSSV